MKFDSHLVFDIISACVTVGWFIVGLAIKNALMSIKLAQARDKSDIQSDFNAKHAENKQDIAVHVAEDEQKFDAISRTLTRIDGKLDRLAERRTT